ncbi:MAG TPA: cellulase family glycosylhydrolase [Bryobacteraceae bacterium]|nr:cellulase family glycosylhydrolase [Bryobacteraceae bacterium]
MTPPSIHFNPVATLGLILPLLACAAGNGPAAGLPLHTQHHWIVDATGARVKLAGVNWYGADNTEFSVGGLAYAPLAAIAHQVKAMGFNSVRIPWSNQLVETNPRVPDYALAANPALKGKRALEVLDLTIEALSREGVYVILDNHVSRADWCCYQGDGNALWHSAAYSEQRWLADWRLMARRYRRQPAVIGADLRNELRFGAAWGGKDPALNWHAAAERGGNAILAGNPNLLIFVEGVDYALDLTGFVRLPVRLNVPNRLVYSAHDYPFDHKGEHTYDDYVKAVQSKWAFLRQESGTPLWIGEFGTCQEPRCLDSSDPNQEGFWFQHIIRFLHETDLDWCYWPLNGTQLSGHTRNFGDLEDYGVLNPAYDGPASPRMLRLLQSVQAPASMK